MFQKTGILIAACGAATLAGCGEASSIGVIGGADGPTAVFVTSQLAPGGVALVVGVGILVVAAVVVAVVVWRKRRKK